MIGLEQYGKIYNNYCICYFGYADEYLVQLRLLRPTIERKFPGLNLYIACKDEEKRNKYLNGDPKSFTKDQLRANKNDFAYIHELVFSANSNQHPVEKFLADSEITYYAVQSELQETHTSRCVIVPRSLRPTKDLTELHVKKLSIFAQKQGYYVEVSNDLRGAGLVIGVESPTLFTAASMKIKTMLVPTGLGTHLYKKMFPSAEVSEIAG